MNNKDYKDVLLYTLVLHTKNRHKKNMHVCKALGK